MLPRRSSSGAGDFPGGDFDVRLDSFAVCEIGREWRLVCPPLDAVLVHFVLRGEGVLEAGGKRTPFAQDDIIVAPKGTAKYLDGAGAVLREITAVDSCSPLTDGMVTFRAHEGGADVILACGVISPGPAEAPGPLDHLTEPVVARIDGSAALEAAFTAMLAELTRPGPGAWLMAESMMKQCVVLLVRDQIRRFGAASPLFAPIADPRLARAITAVMQSPGEPHSVESLARAAGMSRSAFSTLFSAHYHETPASFVVGMRLRTAARMLRMGLLPVKVVATSVGFASRSHFSRAFKAAYGVDPSSYRDGLAPAEADLAPGSLPAPEAPLSQRRPAEPASLVTRPQEARAFGG
jgi:AraC-like DNA-binding protein